MSGYHNWATMIKAVLLANFVMVANCQFINRAPHFIPVTGDMSHFSLPENTIVGTPVYQLKGKDPENGKLHYSISGQYFSVDKMTGVVTLVKPLDREKEEILEVIISITDEDISGSEPNTISLRREIPIIDYNDNTPVFRGRPYRATITEGAEIGTEIQVTPEIIVTDRDVGYNADVQVQCHSKDSLGDTEACEVFAVTTEKLTEGQFSVKLHLKRHIDFESRSTFRIGLKATDGAPENPLSTTATVSIDIIDIQDQPPIFINAPYSATVAENTPEGVEIMDIIAKDGDTGSPRPIQTTLEGDILGYFDVRIKNGSDVVKLVTTSIPIDRENPSVLQNGGVYSFFIKATELIDGHEPSDYSVTQVTIIVTDTDDHKPVFNQKVFNVSMPENIDVGTQIPGLSLHIEDHDLGVNSKYNLSLRNVFNSEGVFLISPSYGEGRTPLSIKVNDSSKLDYDIEDDTLRSFSLDIIASVNNVEVASTRINIKLLDTNDNAPIFAMEDYKVNVLEDVENGFKIADLKAKDRDSGTFGKLEYTLTGFGAEFFKTEKNEGGLFVNRALDFEKQKSYSLTMVAKDGGGKVSTVNVFVEVQDVNDNAPVFDSSEYSRTIRDGATAFEPQFVVRATDRDGPDQGGGYVTYSIESDNSISNSGNIFTINEMTGEIKIVNPVDSMDTPRGQYELMIRATDKGYPPLHNETRVLIRVGVPGNQRPIFKGNYNSFISPKDQNGDAGEDFYNYDYGPMNYKATIPENSLLGTNVTTVIANDPDGLDYLLKYHIIGGAKDNFVIDERTGIITVSPEANLDRDVNPDHYNIMVEAVDSGTPVPETATTTVFVTIQDVNDKPPFFNLSSSTVYVSERDRVNKFIFKMIADDTDVDSDIRFSIIEPIKAISKSGVQLKTTKPYNYKEAFRIDEKSGEIFVNNTLDYNQASVIILTVKVEDVNAVLNKEKQFALTEITFYVQSFTDNTPQFTNDGWTSTNPTIFIKVEEEEPIGSTLFVLTAEDPISGHIVTNFKVINSENDLMQVDPQTGQVLLTKRLDYESLENPNLTMTVKATSNDGSKYSTALINVEVMNINDNSPEFKSNVYKTSIPELSKYPDILITIEAIDMDAILSATDEKNGYSNIRYSLSGQNSNLFVIDEMTGVVQVAPNKTLDRERQSVLRLDVTASDTPNGLGSQQKNSVPLIIDVLDVNDNAPKFPLLSYMAVVPENVNIGRTVVNITAIDPDEGLGGELKYEFIDEGEGANGLFIINPSNGEIRTKKLLSGKGRQDAYILRARATDGGGLYGETSLSIYIGDVSANDGVPTIIKPTLDQVASISENATIGSPVFQVLASDPDDPSLPSGKLVYQLEATGLDASSFHIDPDSGLITTMKQLDREEKLRYELVLVVSDKGEPPQTIKRVLQVNVTDVDDHKPRFIRAVDDLPIVFNTKEEQPKGSAIGEIAAVDEDIGENGAIEYAFISGNELGIFKIKRTDDNKAVIMLNDRLDRESSSHYLLAISCFRKDSHRNVNMNKPYNKLNPSEIQILIKVIDVDDHLPEFTNGNLTLGVRLNAPIGTRLARVHAQDLDPSSTVPKYNLLNITFTSPLADSPRRNATGVFVIDKDTGEITTKKSLIPFVDGFFRLAIRANNSNATGRQSDTFVQMFIVRDRDLLKFVFRAPPSDISRTLPQFSSELSNLLAHEGLILHMFDAQVMEEDHTLDFSSTSSCFQLTRQHTALNPSEMDEALAKIAPAAVDTALYARYLVAEVLPCGGSGPKLAHLVARPHLWLLLLAALLVLAAMIATCSVCCLHQRYKRQSRRFLLARSAPPPPSSMGHPRIYSEPYYST